MKKIFLSLTLVLVVGIVVGYMIGWVLQDSQDELMQTPGFIEEPLVKREVALYFAEPRGRYLLRVTDGISGCEDDRDCVRALLERLIAGPQGKAVRVLPATTLIKGVELDNDLVRINFSRHLVDHHPGGSLTELLTIYSLINSLSESFPYLRQLQILVEGEVRPTLKGHVRIDHPVYADYALTQPPGLGTGTVDPTREQQDYHEIERLIEAATKGSN